MTELHCLCSTCQYASLHPGWPPLYADVAVCEVGILFLTVARLKGSTLYVLYTLQDHHLNISHKQYVAPLFSVYLNSTMCSRTPPLQDVIGSRGWLATRRRSPQAKSHSLKPQGSNDLLSTSSTVQPTLPRLLRGKKPRTSGASNNIRTAKQ